MTDTKGTPTPRTEALASIVRADLNYSKITLRDAMQRYYELAKELEAELTALRAAHEAAQAELAECRREAESVVNFYEREFYPLSNFSAFHLSWEGRDFDTAEHVYHWEKFRGVNTVHQCNVRTRRSAHEAFKYAEEFRADRRPNWDAVKVEIMRNILRAKAQQHEYVRRKLLETGTRTLIECSWRDDFWGWGPKKDGQNMLGKLWMEIRDELAARGKS